MSKKKNIVIVPARAGSKGLPKKNLRLLNGVPLYRLAVEQGLRVSEEVILTTDIKEIFEEIMPKNCIVIQRPERLATDESTMEQVIMDLISAQRLEGCQIILLQPTSPLRTDADIYGALKIYEENDFSLVMTVCRKESSVLKYGYVEDGEFTCLRNNRDAFANRQELPNIFGPNGAVYVFNVDDFMASKGFPVEKIGILEMPRERSIDIDSLIDLQEAAILCRDI